MRIDTSFDFTTDTEGFWDGFWDRKGGWDTAGTILSLRISPDT